MHFPDWFFEFGFFIWIVLVYIKSQVLYVKSRDFRVRETCVASEIIEFQLDTRRLKRIGIGKIFQLSHDMRHLSCGAYAQQLGYSGGPTETTK
jgi:hypothetical protein